MTAPINPAVARQAAAWLMRLGSGTATAEEIADCERWRASDGEHERAWRRAQEVSRKLGLLRADLAMPTLLRVDPGRRATLKTLLILLTAAPVGALAVRATPWREWTADYRSTVGERRDLMLADGTRVRLNTNTALDVSFDSVQRLLQLRTGEVLIDTAADPDRPFLVQTRDGRLRALGTRFLVRQDAEQSRVAVYEGAVEVRPRASTEARIIEANEQLRFDATQVGHSEPADPSAVAWTQGALSADRMRLADFVAELSRHRSGWVRCDPVVADLRVSGVFQLRNTDDVLRSLPDVLPVRVTFRSAYWVMIGPDG